MKEIVTGLVALTATLFTAATLGQGYPSRPIRVVVPFLPGSLADGLARVISPKLAEGLGQPVVVQNKVGAEGSLGAAEVAKASPDGHTLLLIGVGTLVVRPLLYKNLSYDPFKSFERVSLLGNSPQILAAAMNFGSYWFSDRIVLTMYGARPIDEAQAPDLYRIVHRLATRGNIPMPRLYIIPGDTPNAFATGRSPQHAAVAVTESRISQNVSEKNASSYPRASTSRTSPANARTSSPGS